MSKTSKTKRFEEKQKQKHKNDRLRKNKYRRLPNKKTTAKIHIARTPTYVHRTKVLRTLITNKRKWGKTSKIKTV